ncbi:MAG: glycosyltransferase family 9 protein [Chloroflexota bacterium]
MNLFQLLTAVYARLAGLLHRQFYQRPFSPPKKAIIIQPGTVSSVMLTTPMLSQLKRRFPNTRFDWASVRATHPVIVGNQSIIKLVEIPIDQRSQTIDELAFIRSLKAESYDTCFIPDYYPKLAQMAMQAKIPQRVGLWNKGRAFLFTNVVQTPSTERHQATKNLTIAEIGQKSLQLSRTSMTFYPSDRDRKTISQRLIDELGWDGKRPLVTMHPGSADEESARSWPIERYVLLGNRIIRHYQAQILLVGTPSDFKTCHEIAGMIAGDVANWSKRVSIGEIGALTEIADLFIGNDTGASHIAAAMGCQTIAIFGPTDPSVSAPYAKDEELVTVLWKQSQSKRLFDWQDGVSVGDVEKAVKRILD